MDQLIPVVAKLQDVLGAVGGAHSRQGVVSSSSLGHIGAGAGLDLPQIVVVGGQSSGKSSVLESIVGRSFLPRGAGIVTRRPLVLQLYNTALPFNNGQQQHDELTEGDYYRRDGRDHQYNGDDVGNGRDGADRKENVDSRNARSQNKTPGGSKSTTGSASAKTGAPTSIRAGDEWGEFLHVPGKRYYDFAAIRDEIVRETDRHTGGNRGISSQPIHLKIFSPRVLHLTLVDLPGIAKVAVGDQPPDIEDQIRDMCLEYINNPNAIILAVTSGNTDIANSDALKLARVVDPDFDRTVGVLTKLDLMDPGTDASDVLQNKVVPLQRGYVGVVNRGQLDIDRDKSIREGLKKEAEFFRSHAGYRSLQHKCGTANLSRCLNIILMHHIRECLPELKGRIMGMVSDVQQELDALGSPSDDSSTSTLGSTMLSLLSKFSVSFAHCLEGKGTSREGLEMNELFGGARIGFIFNQVFVRSLMTVEAFDGLSDEEIRTTICNANGTRPALFVPEISFDILVRRQITRLEQPGLQCVDLVYNELQRIASQCEPTEFQRFPNLRERMADVVSTLLRQCVSPTQLMVTNLVKIELAYINTSHPDFIGGSKAVARLMDKMNRSGNSPLTTRQKRSSHNLSSSPYDDDNGSEPVAQEDLTASLDIEGMRSAHGSISAGAGAASSNGIMNYLFRGKRGDLRSPNGVIGGRSAILPSVVQLPQVPDTMRQPDVPTERERIETEIIKSLIESYFSIVRKNFIDLVPKTVMHFLVNHARESLQNELVSTLYKEGIIPDLMQEAEDIAMRRNTCHEMKELLQKALEIVNEVRDFNTYL